MPFPETVNGQEAKGPRPVWLCDDLCMHGTLIKTTYNYRMYVHNDLRFLTHKTVGS